MIVEKKLDGHAVSFLFDTGEKVTLWPYIESWEYDHMDVDEYACGIFVLDDNTVIDYDGVFELPEAVIEAFKSYGYNVDL